MASACIQLAMLSYQRTIGEWGYITKVIKLFMNPNCLFLTNKNQLLQKIINYHYCLVWDFYPRRDTYFFIWDLHVFLKLLTPPPPIILSMNSYHGAILMVKKIG